MNRDRLAIWIAAGIFSVWAVVVIAAVVNPDLIALAAAVTPVMLAPAGWLFTDVFIRARRDDQQEQKVERALERNRERARAAREREADRER